MPKRLTAAQIACRRALWAQQNPEEALRRLRKRMALTAEWENVDDDPRHLRYTGDKPKENMLCLWCALRERRHKYLQDNDLANAALSDEEKQDFRFFILYYGENPDFVFETEQLLIEGLKYPEADHWLAKFCSKYLRKKYSRGAAPSITLWTQLWSRSFVPLDAVRIMMTCNDGIFKKTSKNFDDIFLLVKNDIIRHLQNEYSMNENKNKKSERIFYFTALFGLYGDDYLLDFTETGE